MDSRNPRTESVSGEAEVTNGRTKEAALLREAARLLASVESDRTKLEMKLKECSSQAASTINELEKQLDISQTKFNQLQETHDESIDRYEMTLRELQNRIDDLEEKDETSLQIIDTLSREKDIISELNHSMQDENKSLKVVKDME